MIRAIFFDFDLTLADTRQFWTSVLSTLRRGLGLKVPFTGGRDDWGRTFYEFCSAIAAANSVGQDMIIAAVKEQVMAGPLPRVFHPEHLRSLQERYVTAIITGSPSFLIERVVSGTGLNFWKVCGSECLAGLGKEVAIMNLLRELDISAGQAMYVGDHPNDIWAARNSQVYSTAVASGVFDRHELSTFCPDFLIENIEEVSKAHINIL